MTSSKRLKPHGAVLEVEIGCDDEFRDEWERTALARLVAAELLRFRSAHGLSQRALAERLGVKQPFVATLEAGERNPEIETLVRISGALGIEFLIDIRPDTRESSLVTRRARARGSVQRRDGVVILAASG